MLNSILELNLSRPEHLVLLPGLIRLILTLDPAAIVYTIELIPSEREAEPPVPELRIWGVGRDTTTHTDPYFSGPARHDRHHPLLACIAGLPTAGLKTACEPLLRGRTQRDAGANTVIWRAPAKA